MGRGRGNTGYPATLRREVPGQRSGPRSPCRGRSGWSRGRNTTGTAAVSQDRPAGLVRTLQVPPCPGTPDCRLTAKGARIDLISMKVSQNGRVSPKYVKKASVSPYSQNGSRKSPLEIPRFPFLAAFSPKELMGHFDASAELFVKTTKCRPVAHPVMSREVSVRYPHGSPQQAASGDPLLI